MNVPLLLAKRYLFAKRSTNAINIITGISVLGVSIGTAALILVLSVFNGFEDLLSGLFGYFNPEVKVLPAQGKTFVADSARLVQLRNMPGVWRVSESLEETAMFQHDEAIYFGVLKGVDTAFASVTGLDSTVVDGRFRLELSDAEPAVRRDRIILVLVAQEAKRRRLRGELVSGEDPELGEAPQRVPSRPIVSIAAFASGGVAYT